MQSDLLLQEWKKAKQTCKKVIEICKMTHLGRGNVQGRIVAPGEKQTNKQYMNVYDVVYRLCLTKQKEENRVLMVYKDYKDLLKTALLQMAPLLNEEKDIYKLDALRKIWDAYSDMQKRMNNMFAYLNRPYHLKNDKIEDLQRTSINLIAETFFSQNSVAQYELLYFKEIDRMRKSDDTFNCEFLAGLVSMFHQIHTKILKYISNKKARTLYTELYGRYQKYAREYYHRRFKSLKQLSPGEYFTEVNRIYQQERRIATNCFVITAETLVNKEFSEQLIINYKPIFLGSELGLKHILKQGQIQTLKLIVDLNMKLTKNLDGFKQQFQQHIFEQMKSFIDQAKIELTFKKSLVNYCSFVQKIMKKNQQLVNILQAISLVGDFTPYFKSAIEKAFTMSKTPISIEELLAIYTQTKFRVQMDEATFQNEVKNIITIFNCIQNKDLFLLKYSQRFTKRILSINEACLNSHEVFISNLKMNCGTKYTESLETIITQFRISVDNENQLKSIIQKNKLPINLSLKVFSAGVWPTQTLHQIPIQFLPREIQLADECINQYKTTFLSKKTIQISILESKVRWSYHFDSEIKCKNQTCYFDTNMLQATLLNYIYKQRPHKIHLKILHQLMAKINPKLLKQNLNKMVQVAQNLLICEGQGQQTCYSFNNLMKSNKKLISFDQGNSQEQQKLFQNHDLAKDRQIVLDANISKLMKAKKVMDFRSIIQETIKMIRVFVPPAKDVKMSIDRLIAKELLQRDEKDRELIRYKD